MIKIYDKDHNLRAILSWRAYQKYLRVFNLTGIQLSDFDDTFTLTNSDNEVTGFSEAMMRDENDLEKLLKKTAEATQEDYPDELRNKTRRTFSRRIFIWRWFWVIVVILLLILFCTLGEIL